MQAPERLESGLRRLEIDLPQETRRLLLRYLEELQRWNRRINLTAIRGSDEGVEKHLIDSLTLLPLMKEGERLLDIGSGPGLPGLALKIAEPSLRLASVESIGKKASFQRHVVRTLGLGDVEVLAERAEALAERADLRGAFSLVVSRAFSSLADFASLALPFLADEGRLVAMKGALGEEELERDTEALRRLGLQAGEIRHLRLPFSAAERTLIVLGRAA